MYYTREAITMKGYYEGKASILQFEYWEEGK